MTATLFVAPAETCGVLSQCNILLSLPPVGMAPTFLLLYPLIHARVFSRHAVLRLDTNVSHRSQTSAPPSFPSTMKRRWRRKRRPMMTLKGRAARPCLHPSPPWLLWVACGEEGVIRGQSMRRMKISTRCCQVRACGDLAHPHTLTTQTHTHTPASGIFFF